MKSKVEKDLLSHFVCFKSFNCQRVVKELKVFRNIFGIIIIFVSSINKEKLAIRD